MLARAKSFQVGSTSSSNSNSKGGNNWRSEKSASPPITSNTSSPKTKTWRRELPNNNDSNSKIDERRREADLARMKEEIVREVREEVIFTFTFSQKCFSLSPILKSALFTFTFSQKCFSLFAFKRYFSDVLGIITKLTKGK